MSENPDTLFRQACDHAAAGRTAAAAAAVRRVLALRPEHVEALRLSGKLELAASRPAAGRRLLERAASLAPDHPELAYETGVACLACDRPADAILRFHRQLERTPSLIDARFNLAWALRRAGRIDEAIAAYRAVVAAAPGHGAAWFNLGNALLATGRAGEAGPAYAKALELQGPRPELLAGAVLARLHSHDPDGARALLSRLDRAGWNAALHAAEGEVLMHEQRPAEALPCFERALAADPGHRAALIGRVRCLRHINRNAEATDLLRQAERRLPDDAELDMFRAQIALEDGDTAAAVALARRAAERDGSAASFATLGKALALSGHPGAAAEAFRDGLKRHPDCHALHSNLLFSLLHDAETTPEAVFAEHRAFGDYWERRFPAPAAAPVPEQPEGRRLRVGYLSPDFCDHAVALFFEPLLDHHDRAAFELFCYHIPRQVDAVTRRLRAKASHWCVLAETDLEGAIARLRADRLDILVDLAGHTACNLLPVFAARPAPVQVSCVGYPGTTGLTRIDYRLIYGNAPKCGDEQRFSTETLVPCSTLPFRPPASLPEVAPPPFLTRGHVTFGSVGKLVKVGAGVRKLWAEILKAVPEARLLLVAPGAERTDTAQELRTRFAADGIDTDRLDLRPEADLETWLGYMAEIDIILDPFPYTGGTTTRLTQWMGLPLVRLGPETVQPELGWFATGSEDEYRAAAIALAADRAALFELRTTLRARQILLESRNTGVVRELEALYRHFISARKEPKP